MDLDLGGLWSWTVPLWGLFVLVLFLGGMMTAPIVLTPLTGGGDRREITSSRKYRH